ncbi:MAG TPA: nucleoside-diphosphate kinase [Desulfohalobiaceae bacterium]|nr:nucleoside-diphosphate kinase [Desulfohalobiaceae bacterium]
MKEQTLTIVKPDAVERNLAGYILSWIESEGFEIQALKMLHMSKRQAQGFYAVHKDKPFFDSLTDYMSSGPIIVAVLQKDNSIEDYRGLMGPTNPAEATQGTIRHKFGQDIEKNSVHGSDSLNNAQTEINYFFPRLEVIER